MTQQEFINGLGRLAPRHRRCAATIGSFDGVHRGHQALLRSLIDEARARNLPSLVMIFEPQPYEFFARHDAPPRLMRLREKVAALFAQGVDRVLCLKFNPVLRGLSAQAFVDQVLVEKLGVEYLVVGDDFRFGCDRKGDFSFLQRCGRDYRFDVSDTGTQTAEGERISSTRIRALLANDLTGKVAELLGKPYSVSARVCYGRQLGRTLGFPTCNLGMGHYRPAVQGVYAVQVSGNILGGKTMNGVANVGVRPTVSGGRKPLLEVHLLDYAGNLYGECLSVAFLHKLRSEMRFDSLAELQQQVINDIAQARAWFGSA